MTDRPEPGYYWARYRYKGGTIGEWEIVKVVYYSTATDDPAYIEVVGDDSSSRAEDCASLVGPLQPPEDKNDG